MKKCIGAKRIFFFMRKRIMTNDETTMRGREGEVKESVGGMRGLVFSRAVALHEDGIGFSLLFSPERERES
jgi:hypothetical protein